MNSNQPQAKEYTHDGVTDTIYGWAKRTGISRVTLKKRLIDYEWDIERALTEPVREYVKGGKNEICEEVDKKPGQD